MTKIDGIQAKAIAHSVEVAKALLKTDLLDREFTAKEFNKIMKGTTNIKYLRNWSINPENGSPYGFYTKGWEKIATKVREEKVTIKLRQPIEVFTVKVAKTGEKLPICSKYDYTRKTRELLERVFGELVEGYEKTDTITTKRFYYTIDRKLVEKATHELDLVKEYYTNKINKAKEEVERLENLLSTIE